MLLANSFHSYRRVLKRKETQLLQNLGQGPIEPLKPSPNVKQNAEAIIIVMHLKRSLPTDCFITFTIALQNALLL